MELQGAASSHLIADEDAERERERSQMLAQVLDWQQFQGLSTGAVKADTASKDQKKKPESNKSKQVPQSPVLQYQRKKPAQQMPIIDENNSDEEEASTRHAMII